MAVRATRVGAGTGTGFINLLSAANALFLDQTGVYADTIANFSQPNGDRIQLTTDTVANALAHSQQVNGGQDTLITLSDNSTILLKGVSSIDSSFFLLSASSADTGLAGGRVQETLRDRRTRDTQ
jgi:hypothetical protein